MVTGPPKLSVFEPNPEQLMKQFLIFSAAITASLLLPLDSRAGGPSVIQRPDVTVGKVGNSGTQTKGDDIYNTTAVGQTIRLNGRGGEKMVFFFCVMNDGNADEEFSFKGTRKNRKFKISYRKVGGGNITAQVFNGNYVDYLQNPGDGIYVKAVARPTRKYRDKRVSITIKGRVRSNYDPSKIDCAKAVFNNRP